MGCGAGGAGAGGITIVAFRGSFLNKQPGSTSTAASTNAALFVLQEFIFFFANSLFLGPSRETKQELRPLLRLALKINAGVVQLHNAVRHSQADATSLRLCREV